jgi:hypothetical protein
MIKKFAPRSFNIYKLMFEHGILAGEVAPRDRRMDGLSQTTLTDILGRVPQTLRQLTKLHEELVAKLPQGKKEVAPNDIYYESQTSSIEDRIVDSLIKLKDCLPLSEILKSGVEKSESGLENKPVGYALLLLEYDSDGAVRNAIASKAASLKNKDRAAVTSLLDDLATRLNSGLATPAIESIAAEVDPVRVAERYQHARAALVAYAWLVVEKDPIALTAISRHFQVDPVREKILDKLFPDDDDFDAEAIVRQQVTKRVPRAFAELLKLLRNNPDVAKIERETIRAIRNVAVCLCFPKWLCIEACKQSISGTSISIPTNDIQWAKLFVCRVLGTISHLNRESPSNGKSIRERLTKDKESMIDIPMEDLLPSRNAIVDAPRESGPDSVRFLTDFCLGLADKLDVPCNEDELVQYFARRKNHFGRLTCPSIDMLQSVFAVFVPLDAVLLVLVAEHRTPSELSVIRELFGSIQFLVIPQRECTEIAHLRMQIRFIDDMMTHS